MIITNKSNIAIRLIPLELAFLLSAAVTWTGYFAPDATVTEAERLSSVLRGTALISMLFFMVTYSARPLYVLGATFMRPLVIHRRYFGLSAAMAHGYHTVFVILYLQMSSLSESSLAIFVAGPGLLIYLAMACTSNDASIRVLGKNWKYLHSFGMHYLWLIYIVLMIQSAITNYADLSRWIGVVFLVVVGTIRLMAAAKASAQRMRSRERSMLTRIVRQMTPDMLYEQEYDLIASPDRQYERRSERIKPI